MCGLCRNCLRNSILVYFREQTNDVIIVTYSVSGGRICLYALLQGMSPYFSFLPVFVNVKQVWSHHLQWNFRLSRHFKFHMIFTDVPCTVKMLAAGGRGSFLGSDRSFYCVTRQGKFWCTIILLSNGYLDGGGVKHCGGNGTFFPRRTWLDSWQRKKCLWLYIASRPPVCCQAILISNTYWGFKQTTRVPFWRRR